MTTTTLPAIDVHDEVHDHVHDDVDDDVRAEVRAGVLATLPLIVAYAPFAFVVGSAVGAHHEPLAAWAGAWLIFGGSAHLAALHTLDHGGVILAVFTALLVNLRLLIYSASLARHWRDQPRWFRLAGAALIIDPTWMLADERAKRPGTARARRAHHLAVGLTMAAAWSVLIATGAIAGGLLGGAGLEVAVPLCLVTMVAPRLRGRDLITVAAVAAAIAVVARGWPPGTGMLAAIIGGCLAGELSEGAPR
jgi:predicted branched-subunit amino acid permease